MKKLKLVLLMSLLAAGSIWLLPQWQQVALSGNNGPEFGDPLPGLSATEMVLFEKGEDDFKEVEEIKDGLGPGFNARSCGECHSTPANGGASAMTVVRFGRIQDGQFDPLAEKGGSLLQLFAISPDCQERVPREANVVARRVTPPLFGAGLVENIPDEAIIANAAAEPPEVRGRVHMVTDKATGEVRVGRFGWKAQQATLLSFSSDAYLNEMGITSRLDPNENAPNGDMTVLAGCDKIPDPEDKLDPDLKIFSIDKFAHFMRLLGPPPRGQVTPEVTQGQIFFNLLSCGACHKPQFQTGNSTVAALDNKPVNAFSDFLLHNVGTGDRIVQGEAQGTEFRTPPLWGLRGRGPFLHDGSAATVEEAILRHGGQALSSRIRFQLLGTAQKRALEAYLNSL